MSRVPEAAPAGGGQVAVPTGNTFDKYGSTNPAVRRLMAGFEGTLAELFDRAAPESVLDVGCGEGVLTYRWAEQLGTRPVLGIDLADPKLEVEWSTRRRANLEFRAMAAERAPVPGQLVRPRGGDRGARARARSRAHARRDGAGGRAAPARSRSRASRCGGC